MFRAQRNGKFSGSGEKIDFKFSNLQALQVPKLWDKLLVSIVSVDTGKTITRSNEAFVRNGNCQWTETLSISIWIQHNNSSKELEEHLIKFVVSMRSARSSILGEATVNMARYYTSSRSSSPVSLPLKHCNYGTILQVKIQCLTPRTKLKHMFVDEDYDHAGSRSNGSAASLNLKPKSTSLLEQIKIMETCSEPSVMSVASSKNLLEAAEDAIEESSKLQELESLKVKQEARISELEDESNITSICLDNLRNDLMVLNNNLDSQVSANKFLEKVKCEMELSLFETEEENIKLLERVSDLESQLARVKDEHEMTRLECEYVKSEKQKLQESAENLINECNMLQKSYEDITNGNAELYDQYSHMVTELTSETELFRKEVEDLKEEISRLDEQKSKLTSEKVNLESSHKEMVENEIRSVREESELKIQNLTTKLAEMKQNHKKLMADHEKKSKLLTSYRTRENNLELKLTVSEHERQQLVQETANLKDEVLDYKRKLDKLINEKSNLEASLISVSNSFEELKAEKMAFFNKMSEFEDSKNASRLQDADMKNEISRIKSVNLQYRLKIQQFEGEKKEFLKKIEDLQLQSLKSKTGFQETRSLEDTDYAAKIKMLETELHEALDANNKYKVQLQKLKSKGRNSLSSGKSKVEGEVVTKERFEKTKSSLETELKDLRDRYLEMSLKYAEVEAERGDLVMQLKTNSARKRVQLHENP